MAFHDLFYEIIASKCVFHTISISWQFEKEMSSHHITTEYQSWNFISHIATTYITHYDSGTASEFQTYTFLLTLFSTPVHIMCLLTLAYLFCHF